MSVFLGNIMRNLKKIFLTSMIATVLIITIIYSNQLNKNKSKKIYKINLDTRIAPNETQILQHISNEMPYLPIEDLNNIHYQSRNLNNSCAWYPTLSDIKIHNDYWQEFHNAKITFYIFGAYLDNRPTVVKDEPVVRILTMAHFIAAKDEEYPKAYCQLWYEEQREPIIMPAKGLHRLWFYEWGHQADHSYGHFISCSLPKEHIDWIPRTVSLVSKPCDKATNNVRVTYMPLKGNEAKKGFAICMKTTDFPYVDLSHRLVEYMEAVRLLGASKIVMYKLQVHPNITKVLKYYEKTGFVEYRPFSLSWEAGNLPEYRHMEMKRTGYYAIKHEVIPYNDCLYRNMYHYDYVANVDIDEIIMPLDNFSNWFDLTQFGESIKDANCKKFASFCFRCVYFPRYPEKPRYTYEIPEYFYMLQHVERVRDHIRPDWATKCFHSTNHVIATHNHEPFHYTGDVCSSYSFNASDAELQHYREPDIKETLNDPVIDNSLWRFKDEIIERSNSVFKELNFLEEISSED